MPKTIIKILRVGNRMIVLNGIDPMAYVDLTKVNKGDKSKAVVRYKAKNQVYSFIHKVIK